MTYVDLRGWITRYEHEASLNCDTERQRLPALDREGKRLRVIAPQEALALFREGAALARRLGEPCWRLYFDHSISGIYIHSLSDPETGARLANENLVEARKPQYTGCPFLGLVYHAAIYALASTDSTGHAERIHELIDYVINHIALDYDTACRLASLRAHMALELDDLEGAFVLAQECLALSTKSPFRLAATHLFLADLSYWRGELSAGLEHAQESEANARQAGHDAVLTTAIAWQALLHRRLGDEDAAHDCYRRAVAQQGRLSVSSGIYVNAVCYFLEAGGEAEQALALRDRQLAESLIDNRPTPQTRIAQLRRARLRGRMGLLQPAEIDDLRALISDLRDPTLFLERIDCLERGNFEERPW